MPGFSSISTLRRVKCANLEENTSSATFSNVEEPHLSDGVEIISPERCISEKEMSLILEAVPSPRVSAEAVNTNSSIMEKKNHQDLGKRRALEDKTIAQDYSKDSSNSLQDSSSKKQKTLIALDVNLMSNTAISSMDQISSSSVKKRHLASGTPKESKVRMTAGNVRNESDENTPEMPECRQSSSEWKPIEKELYLKGIEIFGRNR